MTRFDPGKEPDHWVKYSALLDIWQDEEEPDEDDLRAFGCKIGLPERTLSQFLAWLPSGKKARTASDGDTAGSVERFFELKGRRVWANLRLDRTCYDLANDVAKNQEWGKKEAVTEAKGRRLEILNDGFLECAAALRMLPTNPTDRDTAHLRALWFTEMCATAPDESTLGLVRAFPPPDLDCGLVFKLIALHNSARCRNHLHQHDDAVKVLESLADDPAKGTNEDPTILRLVGFPALASMADALTHLLRHVEARWYWTQGLHLASKTSSYWQRFFQIKLSDSRAQTPAPVSGLAGRPKLENLLQDATRKAFEEAWRTKATTPDEKDCESWLRTIYWKLAWHAAESRELLNSLEGTMKGLCSIAETRRYALSQSDSILNKKAEGDCLQSALSAACSCLRECATEQAASWLHPDPDSKRHCGFIEPLIGKLAWEPIWETYRALVEVQKLSELKNNELAEWLTALETRVRDFKDTTFRYVPAVHLEQVVEAYSLECKANPSGVEVADKNCPEFGCPVCGLHLQDAAGPGQSDDPLRPPLAGLEYVLATMAHSAAGFDRYLSGSTAEMEGTEPRTPKVEFMSLRRWNSFSPNLGSLAADTVGGGYLLRIWTGEDYFGLAIDPGYNFLENLFNEGLTIADLDLVAVTHAHPDHTDSITNLLTLLRESKKRASKPKNTICFAMSAGVLERYQEFLHAEVEFIPEVVMLSWAPAPGNAASQSELAIRVSRTPDRQRRLSIDFNGVEAEGEPLAYLKAIPAYHDDGTRKDSTGFEICIPLSPGDGRAGEKLVVGVLGDSRYHPLIKDELRKCDLVVLHLGAVMDDRSFREATKALTKDTWNQLLHLHREDESRKGCNEKEGRKCAQAELYALRKKNQLYWTGATKLLCDLLPTSGSAGRAPLVVLSEFGEELRGGLRADLARRLEGQFRKRRRKVDFPGVIPADVGLRIDVAEKTVRCAVCERYRRWEEMDAIAVRPADEGLSFVCRDCQSLREHELGEILSRRRAQVRVPQKLREKEKGPA